MTYNFTRTDEPGQYLLRQDSQHFGLQYLPIDHEYRYTGKLTVKDPSIPARMTVSFPLSKYCNQPSIPINPSPIQSISNPSNQFLYLTILITGFVI